MTVVVTHTTPADGTFSAAGAAAWDADHDLSGLGTLAEQDANAVAITGGTIDNTAIGGTTPAAGTFTEVAVTTATGDSAFNENNTITGWLYSGNTFFIGSQESAPTGLFIGNNGTKMYVNGSTGDDVNEYTLGTAWNITTATFVTVFSVAAQDTAPADLFFKPDGLSMYVVGDTNNTVFQYTLGTAWSVATASYASKSFSVGTQETNPSGLWFKPDGTVMYVVGSATDAVYQYTLSTAWDVSTASYGGIFYSIAAQETAPSQVNLSDDGLKMWVNGTNGDDIWEYDLGTAWNVNTATPVNNFYIGFQSISSTGMFIDSTAPNRVFVVDSTQDAVYQYNTANNAVKLDTSSLDVGGALRAGGNFVAGANAYVDGTLGVQGATQLATTTVNGSLTAASTINLAGATTSTTSLGTAASTGTFLIGGTGQTGSITLGQSTVSQTTNIQAGATTSGNTKTINFGTAGLSGSTTNINIGSAVSGSLGTTTISAPTVNISTGANGVNISNGGTVTAITRTAAGSGYTSVPSVAISAPTTAGGVQATATATAVINGITSIQSGGTGYTVNDVLTVVGGTATTQTTQLTVATVSAGVITSVTVTRFGTYSTTPTNPASVTGGTGTGATFNLNYAVQTSFTITNAGSGYVEQPTVTFSGGGGSGAAAYATVGSGTVVKTLGSSMSFLTPAGEALRLRDSGGTATDFIFAVSSPFGRPVIGAQTVSGGGNSGLGITSWGTSAIQLYTNNTATEQVRIANTSSAVNYVQMTGAATGNRPTISAQGSDANISFNISAKGTGQFTVLDGNGFTGFVVQPRVTNGDTWIETQRNVGFVDLIAASGVANGDIRLTPKGTGNVRFGTYTGTVLTPTGFIEIKDSSGTIRRLLVG